MSSAAARVAASAVASDASSDAASDASSDASGPSSEFAQRLIARGALFAAGSDEGLHLLAHEFLCHMKQQCLQRGEPGRYRMVRAVLQTFASASTAERLDAGNIARARARLLACLACCGTLSEDYRHQEQQLGALVDT